MLPSAPLTTKHRNSLGNDVIDKYKSQCQSTSGIAASACSLFEVCSSLQHTVATRTRRAISPIYILYIQIPKSLNGIDMTSKRIIEKVLLSSLFLHVCQHKHEHHVQWSLHQLKRPFPVYDLYWKPASVRRCIGWDWAARQCLLKAAPSFWWIEISDVNGCMVADVPERGLLQGNLIGCQQSTPTLRNNIYYRAINKMNQLS